MNTDLTASTSDSAPVVVTDDASVWPSGILYDEGEESWPLKIHLGCGGIRLDGYINIDITGSLASESPELAEVNRTDLRDYYARLTGTSLHLPIRRPTVVDRIANLMDPPFPASTVDKIVCIQTLEHLAIYDVFTALTHWWNILKPEGVVVIAVPDMNGTLRWLGPDNDPATRDFAQRHLRGSMRDKYNFHRTWFNRQDLRWILEQNGFYRIEELQSFHVYPAIVVRAKKNDRFVSDRSYQFPLPGYDAATCLEVLDVGPGDLPLRIATRCFDVSDRYQSSRLVPADIGNVEALPYADQEYDYVYASHILEHTEHPAQAIRELQRVGKRGYVEVPSVMLDWIMQHGEAHVGDDGKPARWMCLKIPDGIVFVERDPELLAGFTDRELGTWIHRVTQYQIPLSEPERYLRDFFWRSQDVLNVHAAWDETHAIHAVEIRLDGTLISAFR